MEETDNVEKRGGREILDHMARIEVDLDIGEGQGANSCCLVSYHCEYEDYLEDHNLLDVSTYYWTSHL